MQASTLPFVYCQQFISHKTQTQTVTIILKIKFKLPAHLYHGENWAELTQKLPVKKLIRKLLQKKLSSRNTFLNYNKKFLQQWVQNPDKGCCMAILGRASSHNFASVPHLNKSLAQFNTKPFPSGVSHRDINFSHYNMLCLSFLSVKIDYFVPIHMRKLQNRGLNPSCDL